MKSAFFIIALVAFLNGCSTDVPPPVYPPVDSVRYSFVCIGCNRLEKKDIDLAGNPSTANLIQLNRTFDDIAALSPKPDFLFFTGDAILGYTVDSNALARQLVGWKSAWESSKAKAAGIELIPMPGNHESENSYKLATTFAEHAWLDIMRPYLSHSGNGPVPHSGDPDNLQTDQSKLTYSFDYKDSHFIVISTDPVGRDSRPPSNWVAADALAARANPGIKHIFAVGHKPAYPYDFNKAGASTDGELTLYPANRDILWKGLVDAKAEAMITAHNHIYRAFQPTGNTWMVVAGNGGSLEETDAIGAKRFYGFTLVQILKSGKVIQKSYGRDYGASYLSPSPADQYPTTVRDSNILSWY